MKIMLDTNIVISALIFGGRARKVLPGGSQFLGLARELFYKVGWGKWEAIHPSLVPWREEKG